MKGIATKSFFTVILCLMLSQAKSQTSTHRCGTVTLSPLEKSALEKWMTKIMAEQPLLLPSISSSKNAKIANAGTSCIPIKVHDVLDGAGGGAVNMTLLNRDLANLNYHFQAANLEFYFCGTVNTLNNATYYDFDVAEETALLAAEPRVTNAFNLYLTNSMADGANIFAGYAYFPFNSLLSTVCIMDKNVLAQDDNGTIVHEFGHHFNLYHTFEGTENGNADPNAENVPRSGAGSNCTTGGDLLCDTDADPNGTYTGCTYTGVGTDILGNVYTPPMDNIMSYYPNQCGGFFTAGQTARIVAARTIRAGHSAYTLNCPAASVTPASGLTAVVAGSQVNLTWTDNAANEMGYLIERSTTSAATGYSPLPMGGVAANATTYADNTIASNTTYYYRIKASNGDCNTYSNVATVSTGLIYCTPTYVNNCSGATISNFTFTGNTTINNTTGCAAPSFTDYSTTISADVTAGSTYSFSVTRATTNGRYIQLYIDFNRDGDFLDAGEKILPDLTTFTGASVTYAGTNAVTVPPTAINGTTRLRIMLKNTTGGAITSACETNIGFGESEDYSLVISGGGLPVEFLSFTGKAAENKVVLNWSTAREIGNDHFELERSENGMDFFTLAEIKGTANASEISRYEYSDENPYAGKNFYRLKQVDFDRKFAYTSIIVVELPVKAHDIQIFPNPFSTHLEMECISDQEGPARLEVIDLAGKNILQEKIFLAQGLNTFVMYAPLIPSGSYFVKVTTSNTQKMFRVVKE